MNPIAIHRAEDPAQLAFEVQAAMLLANARCAVSRDADPLNRARAAIESRLVAAGAPPHDTPTGAARRRTKTAT